MNAPLLCAVFCEDLMMAKIIGKPTMAHTTISDRWVRMRLGLILLSAIVHPAFGGTELENG